jgi:hypothetical protein
MLSVLFAGAASAENIDPYKDNSRYAYGENIGWLNFKPNQGPGVHVSSTEARGFVWAENIGWINLSPAQYGGVINDGDGDLSGYAWGENVGWINFGPAHGGVVIQPDGNFNGWAWGENIGWIHLQSAGPVAYKVQACVVTIDDLANFAELWLIDMDGEDFARLIAQNWLNFCPDNWQLK